MHNSHSTLVSLVRNCVCDRNFGQQVHKQQIQIVICQFQLKVWPFGRADNFVVCYFYSLERKLASDGERPDKEEEEEEEEEEEAI